MRDSIRTREELLQVLNSLAVGRGADGQRAPHKPLLLLWVFAHLQRTGSSIVPFEAADEEVSRLIDQFSALSKERNRAYLPFWHLESEGIWRLEAASHVSLQRSRSALLR